MIVHCKEDNDMTAWYNEIPSSWDVTVYETCQQKVYPNKSTMQRQRWHSVQFQNAGSEECTAYFDYILHNRDHLADITVFLQTDTFRKYGNKKKIRHLSNITGHSPFIHFDELVKATSDAMVRPGQQKFLHYGWPLFLTKKRFGANMKPAVRHDQPYAGKFLPEMWDIFTQARDVEGRYININHNFEGEISTRPGAIFAVHKDRILANSPNIYQKLKDTIMLEAGDHARRRCCSLEVTWHVLFGETAVLPKESTVDQYYDGYDRWEY